MYVPVSVAALASVKGLVQKLSELLPTVAPTRQNPACGVFQSRLYSETSLFLYKFIKHLVLGTSAVKQANLVQKTYSAIEVQSTRLL